MRYGWQWGRGWSGAQGEKGGNRGENLGEGNRWRIFIEAQVINHPGYWGGGERRKTQGVKKKSDWGKRSTFMSFTWWGRQVVFFRFLYAFFFGKKSLSRSFTSKKLRGKNRNEFFFSTPYSTNLVVFFTIYVQFVLSSVLDLYFLTRNYNFRLSKVSGKTRWAIETQCRFLHGGKLPHTEEDILVNEKWNFRIYPRINSI